MKKYFFLISFLLIFFPIKYAWAANDLLPASGINSAKGESFVINIFKPGLPAGDPQSRVIKEGQDFQVSIMPYKDNKVDNGFFKSGSNYPFYINGQTRNGSSSIISCEGTFTRGDNNDLWGTIPLGSDPTCSLIKSGPAKLIIYDADTHILANPANKIIDSVPFSIDSAQGGEVATIDYFTNEEVNKTVCNLRTTKVSLKNASKDKKYVFYWDGAIINKAYPDYTPSSDNNTQTIALTGNGLDYTKGSAKLCMIEADSVFNLNQYFPAFVLNECNQAGHNLTFNLKPTPDQSCPAAGPTCKSTPLSVENNTNKYKVTIQADGFNPNITLNGNLIDGNGNSFVSDTQTTSANGDTNFNLPQIAAGIYTFTATNSEDSTQACTVKVEVSDKVAAGGAATAPPLVDFKSTVCGTPRPDGTNRCAESSGEYCDAEKKLLKTAIGCVPVDPGTFIAGLMRYITGFSGGIALLLMAFGSFQMITSAGNADSLKKGREQFVSAVIGLLFIIFATLLMQIIGVDILGLPGFSK